MKSPLHCNFLYLFFCISINAWSFQNVSDSSILEFNNSAKKIEPIKDRNSIEVDHYGNLVYTDIVGVDDDIRITIEGLNYRLSNSAATLVAGRGIKQDGHDVLVPITLVTGEIKINTKGGDDTFTVDFSKGDFKIPIQYDGGGQNTVSGDDMVLLSSDDKIYDSVEHTFINDNDGLIDITGNSNISYIGLEPITDNLNVDDRVFTFTGNLANTEQISLEAGGTLGNLIDSNYGESVDFVRPNNSLTINTSGFGDDILDIKGLAIGNYDLTVNGGDGDEIRFSNNAINLGGGSLNLTSHEIHFLRNVFANTITTTSGSVTAIESATVKATNGSLSMTAGTVVPPIDGINTDTGGLYMNFGTIETTGTHDININATTYSAINIINQTSLIGFSMEDSSIITRFGDITITGNGVDNGLADFSGVRMGNNTVIQSLAADITINGTGRNSVNNTNIGVSMVSGNIRTSTLGIIDITGVGYLGIDIKGTIGNNSGLNVSLQGTSGAMNVPAINISSTSAILAANNNINLTANTGYINTPSGVATQSQLNGINTIINGVLAPGQSPGQFIMNTDLRMDSGDVLEIEIDDFTTAGTDYDQLQVNRSVVLNNATLNFVDNSGSFPEEVVSLTIIDNDGTDQVSGTFNGLAQGASIAGNGKTWYIFYNQGDGNDVVLTSASGIPHVTVNQGNMLFTGITSEDDNLTIIVDGANYRISDSGKPVIAGAGTIQDGNDTLVPISSITGSINVNTETGNDHLTIDVSGGDFVDAINFDGGTNSDGLSLSGISTYNDVTHTVSSNGDGTILITGNSIISHTNLEQSIVDNLDVDNRVFTLNSNNSKVFAPLGTLENQVAVAGVITIDYNNPNNTLTINGSGISQNFCVISGFATGFDANVNISRNDDTIDFQGMDVGTGSVFVVSKVILVRGDVSTEGAIQLVSFDQVYIEGGSVTSSAGENINIFGGTTPTPGAAFSGLSVIQSTIQTTGAGAIQLVGLAFSDNASSSSKEGITTYQANIISDTGDISISGTGPNMGTDSSIGINMSTSTNIQSNGGHINITGTGGNSSGDDNKGVIIFDTALIATAGAGTITIEGTGGTGTDTNYGVEMQANAIVRTENGDVSITGSSIDAIGSDQTGMIIEGVVNTTGTGNISVTGTSSTANDSSINLASSGAQLLAGGNLLITGNQGPINTPNGITSQTQFSAIHTTIDGVLAPGQSPGQLTVVGNLTMNSSDTLEMEVIDFNTAGIDFDQIMVNGTVNINGVDFNLLDTSASFSSPETLILISNDGTDAINGTFNGLPQGTSIAGNEKIWKIYYDQGDGNDVVLISSPNPNVIVDGSGNLVYTGMNLDDDNLTIIVENAHYRISDSGKPLIAGAGTTQDGNDVLIPIASITGAININTNAGNDSLTVNFNGGDFSDAINFDGGGNSDGLSLSGGATFNTVTHTVNDAGEGTVDISGNGTITYIELEQTIVDDLNVNDRVFTLNLSDFTEYEPTGSLENQVSVSGVITIDYNNPNNSLTLNGAGTGQGFNQIKGFAAGFDADLFISKLEDTVRFGAPGVAGTGTDLETGNFDVRALNVLVRANVTTEGAIVLESINATDVSEGNITSTAGEDITISAGTQPTETAAFSGLEIFVSTIQTTGTGTITLSGQGFIDNTFSGVRGITLFETNLITDTGDIDITGISATTGSRFNTGINMSISTNIQSSGGNINIIGTAGNSIGDRNIGIVMYDGTNIQTTGTGIITIDGTGGTGTDTNYGIEMQINSVVQAENGAISITGSSLNTTGVDQIGLLVNGVVNTTGSGDISMTGTSSAANYPSINLPSSGSQFNAGGNLLITGNTGPINTPNGISGQAQFSAINTTIHGILAPGQSPGQLTVNGNFEMSSGDTLEMEVADFNTAGTDFDQIVVNGTVDLNGVTLNLTDSSGSFSSPENLILIDNDGTDPVVGTFNGLSNGTLIAGNGKNWYIYYNLGGTNDVLLSTTPPNIHIDGSGNLVFQDPYSLDDNLTIIVDGTNYRISDSVKPIIAGSGTTQDGNDVLVTITDVTGDININTGEGDDFLNIDFEGGNIMNAINYDGEVGVDGISLSGTNIHDNIAHTITGNKIGFIDISNNGTINYTGLEHTIRDFLDANDRVFTFKVQASRIIIQEAGAANNQIFYLNGTKIEYKNPLNSLTIDGDFEFQNGNFATTFVDIEAMGSGFDADLIIHREHDNVRFNTVNTTNLGSGNLNVTSGSLELFFHNITTTGSVTTTSKRVTNIRNATIQAEGDISITSGTLVLPNNIVTSGLTSAHLETTGSGNIIINGTAYAAFNINNTTLDGFYMIQSSSISTDAGDITIIGNGVDNGNAKFRGLRLQESSNIQSNTGDITITGTGRNNNNDSNIGVSMLAGTNIQTAGEGAINITGTGWIGLELDGIVSTTGTGNVWLHGTSGAINASAINLPSSNAQLQSGGFLYLNSNVGPVNTPEGITSQIQFNGHTSLNGVLAPGQSPGQLIVTGNLAIGTSNNTLEMEVNDFTTAGIDYDQVVVNGIVNLNGGTLNLIDNSGSFSNFETLVLIDNDATDQTIGIFNGLPNGAPIAGNGKTWYIYYNQGDGNDVVLSSELLPNVLVDGSGNLVFQDPYLANDDLTIIVDGLNYRISDSSKLVIAGAGATQDGNDVLVSVASVTGTINILTGDGNDNLNINLSGGGFQNEFYFDGGTQNNGMSLSGSGNYANVVHTFTDTYRGTIQIPGNSEISYNDLNLPITDNLDVNNRTFNMGQDDYMTLSAGGSLDNQINVFSSTIVDFGNPNNSLSINNTDSGNKTVVMQGLAVGFDADLSINVQEGNDVRFDTNPTNIGNGNLNLESGRLVIDSDGSIITTGLIVTSTKSTTTISGTIQSNGGSITITAGTEVVSGSNFGGIYMYNGHVETTGSGDIILDGTIYLNIPAIVTIDGFWMTEDSSVITDTGNIIIRGNGVDNGNANFRGVRIEGTSSIQSNAGDINIFGIGRNQSDLANVGAWTTSNTTIQTAGTGTINVEGVGHIGLELNGVISTLGTGNISLEGTSGATNVPAIDFVSSTAQVLAGGNLSLISNVGSINTPVGITGQNQFSAITTTIDGYLAPGQSPGQLRVSGDFEMNSGDTLEIEINDFTIAGTDYDQIVVNGIVDIDGATLNVLDTSGILSEDPETLVLISNDGVDPIVGVFNGLPNGSSVIGNGKTWYIYYNQGDGNDVVLSSDRIPFETLISPKIYLQGAAINPNVGQESLMRDDLRLSNLIPQMSPYGDGLVADASVFAVVGADAIVDWVWIELRDENNSALVLSGQSALLQRDGDIVSLDGVNPLNIDLDSGNYYVAVNHRNHLGIMSSAAISLNSTNTLVDFTDGSISTYGSNGQTVLGMPIGIQGLWAGDTNSDGIVQYSGGMPDTPGVLSYVLNDPANFLNLPTHQTSGYSNTDVNMDGVTQYAGSNSELPFVLQNVLSYPANFLGLSTWPIEEQLPANLGRYMQLRNDFENSKN
ncbi:hypothetical protein [uncultured Psychroserpens sp.]|uniref:beta strand repeat-containing protein n=1 Tax=uncultured Psychroserpens sp. TaxID=255436 RepID=UPI00262D8CC9|nr:hypothetical protein [uncultured Psychroserpens sp.]